MPSISEKHSELSMIINIGRNMMRSCVPGPGARDFSSLHHRAHNGAPLSQSMTASCNPVLQPALRIRRARAAEAAALTELSLRSKALWGYDAAFLARCRIAMQVKEANIDGQPHYVAELDGQMAG